MQTPARQPRDWFWLEVPLLVAVLMAGAAVRYWLSTVVPFDETELEVLRGASVPERSGRVPLIMINGVVLFCVYLGVRRSVGPAGAFVVLLLLQTSLPYQELAQRIRFWPVFVLVALVPLTYFRFQRPAGKLPQRANVAAATFAGLLLVRGAHLALGLPETLERIERQSRADPALLDKAWTACLGDRRVGSMALLEQCDPELPVRRSLAQQEALLDHRARIGRGARIVTEVSSGPADHLVLHDPAGAGFIAFPQAQARTATQVISADSQAFLAARRAPAP